MSIQRSFTVKHVCLAGLSFFSIKWSVGTTSVRARGITTRKHGQRIIQSQRYTYMSVWKEES